MNIKWENIALSYQGPLDSFMEPLFFNKCIPFYNELTEE